MLSRFLGGAAAAVFMLLVAWVVTGCSHKEVNPDDPDAVFADAEEAFQEEKYLLALEKYRDVKNRFPYSARAADAEMRIADTLYSQESYLEAASAYEIFRELHPSHSKSDYVQYRIAMSYYSQIPGNSARDLTAAHRAIDEFNRLAEKFPGSRYVSEARQLVAEARRRLAEHENYVADFYFQRKHYLSASYRYSALLQDYPNLGYDEEALYRLAKSYQFMKMASNAKDAWRRLLKQFPASPYLGEARAMIERLERTTQQ